MDSSNQHCTDSSRGLLIPIATGNLRKAENIIKRGVDVDTCILNRHPAPNFATNNNAFLIARRLLELGSNPQDVSTEISQEGYTPLHLACMKNNYELAELLITAYRVDANAAAADGIQPIHFAIFNENYAIIRLLMNASVNLETRIDREVFKKYYKKTWREDFGDSVTLLTYAVLYNKIDLVTILIEYGADVLVRSFNGQTLLMTSVFYRYTHILISIIAKLKRPQINYCDNDGLTATHYLFKREVVEHDWLLDVNGITSDDVKFRIIKLLYKAGADFSILIKGDPATHVINIIGYLHDHRMLSYFLPRQKFSRIVKPLYYSSLPDSAGSTSIHLSSARRKINLFHSGFFLPYGAIVTDIKLRTAVGYPVLPEEYDKVDTLRLNLHSVYNFDKLVKELKRKIIKFDENQITVGCILSKSDRELKVLAKNKFFLQAIDNFCAESSDEENMIANMIKVRVNEAVLEVLKSQFEKVVFFSDTAFYYIPFYCILEIIKYLNDFDDVKNLITAYGQIED